MDWQETQDRLATVNRLLADAGRYKLTQVQQMQLKVERTDLERYLMGNSQTSMPFANPNELRPAIPPSPVPEWKVPEGGYQPPQPYSSILRRELRAAEGVAPSAPAVQSTLWGEHFPSVEKVKEVTEALEGGSTAARKFLESLKPEEREAFLKAAREIAEAEAREAAIRAKENAPRMLDAAPSQTGQMTMPFGDLATSEVGQPQMGRLPIGPDLTARIEQAAQLAERLREFEPHQQSVLWGSKVEDFKPERPVYEGEPPRELPPDYYADETLRPQPPPTPPTAAVHQMDVETAKKTYPALRRLADQINRREAELNKQRQRIQEAREEIGSEKFRQASERIKAIEDELVKGVDPRQKARLQKERSELQQLISKPQRLQEQYARIQSKGPRLEESPQILETVQRMENEIGRENLETYTLDIPPTPPMRGRIGTGTGGRGGEPRVPGSPEAPLRPPPPPPPSGSEPIPRAVTLEDIGVGAENTPGEGKLGVYGVTRTRWEDDRYALNALEKAGRRAGGEELDTAHSPMKRAQLFAGVYGRADARLRELRDGIKPIRQSVAEDLRTIGSEAVRFSAETVGKMAGVLERAGASPEMVKQWAAQVGPKMRERGAQPAWNSPLVRSYEEHMLNNHLMDVLSEYPAYREPRGRTREQVIREQRALEASLSPDDLARIRQAEQATYKHLQQQLQDVADSGLIPSELVPVLREMFPRYVPLNRVVDLFKDAESWAPGRRSLSIGKQDIIRRLNPEGSEMEIMRPLESITKRTFASASLAEANRVARTVADLRHRPEFRNVVIEMAEGTKAPPGMKKISAFEDGVKRDFAVPQPVAEALQGMTKESADILTRMAGASGAALRNGATTLNLAFLPRNIARDWHTAAMRSPVGFTPMDWVYGVFHTLGDTPLYRRFLENEGGMAGFFEIAGQHSQGARHLVESGGTRIGKTILNPFKMMRVLSEAVEAGTRVGLHRRMEKAGVGGLDAGFVARNSTIDFAKAGSWMRIANMFTPFLNARTQGTLNMTKTFRDNPKDAALTATALIGLPVIAAYLYNTRNHPDIDRDIRDFHGKNYYYLIYGTGKDAEGNYTDVFNFPKETLGGVFGGLLTNALRFIDQHNPQALDTLAKHMGLMGDESEQFPAILDSGSDTERIPTVESVQAPKRQFVEPESAARAGLEALSEASPVDFMHHGEFAPGYAFSQILPPGARGVIENEVNYNFWKQGPVTHSPGASPSEHWGISTPERAIEFSKTTMGRLVGDWLGWGPDEVTNFVYQQFGGLGRQALNPGGLEKQALGWMTGAPAGRLEDEKYERWEPQREQYESERVRGTMPARRLFKEASVLPEEERGIYLSEKIKELDAANTFELFDLISKSQGGLTRAEESMRYDPVGARAANMLKEIEAVGDGNEQELAEMMSRWAKNGLLTEETVEMMTQIQGAKMAGEAPVLRPAKPKR